jgi:hypothetical protein
MNIRKDFFKEFPNNLPYKSITAVVLVLLFVLPLLQVPVFSPSIATVQAATGDFSIDFVAAEPSSYYHNAGGGAYDVRNIGVDVVESLEGGDFACGDTLTYFAEVAVANTQSAINDGPQTIEMDFSFLMDTTGQSGVAISDILDVSVNYGTIVDLIDGEDDVDQGISDDGGSVATLIAEDNSDPLYTPGSVLEGTVELNDLEAGEKVVVRIDVLLSCDLVSDPTGNLQAALDGVRLTYINGDTAVDPPQAIPSGGQTIPFKVVSQILFPGFNLFKSVSLEPSCPGEETLSVPVGTTVYYCFQIYNNGQTSLYNITLNDPLLGGDIINQLSGFDFLDVGTVPDLALDDTPYADNYSSPLAYVANQNIINTATADADGVEPDAASCTVTVYSADFGDLPAGYQLTSLLDDGARHEIGDLWLGNNIDHESDGQEDANAYGDGDDDDGVFLPAGFNWSDGVGELEVVVNGTEPGCLTAWLDFIDDGPAITGQSNYQFTDSITVDSQTYDELIIDNELMDPGTNPVTFGLPVDAADGGYFFARFRLVPALWDGENYSCGAAPGLTGYSDNGEVEDYLFIFGPNATTLTKFAASSNGGVPAGLLIAAGLLGIALLAFYVIRSRRIHLNGS